MSGIERALAGRPFTVDPTQCYLQGQRVQAFSPADETYPWSSAPIEAQIVFKLFFVSICHQINWDFLQRAMFETFFSPNYEEMVATAASARSQYIAHLLGGYHRKERIRATERAKYLRLTADTFISAFHGAPSQLVAEGRVFGNNGLLEQLAKIPAFNEDPLAKKSNALAQELARERIIDFTDASRIPPAIDYHLIRLYLRTGRVVPKTQQVFLALRTGTTHRMRLVKLLREEVSAALSLTATSANLPVHELNYLEWQIARSRCEREFTNCDGNWPDTLMDASVLALDSACPLRHSCSAYHEPQWKSILEPELKKSFY